MKAKLIKPEQKTSYAEAFQSLVVKFSFVKKIGDNTYERMFTPVKCRDFLGDCIHSKNFKRPVTAWGFTFDYEKTPYDEDKFRMMMKFPDDESKANFLKNISIIHSKEEKAGVTKAEIIETEDNDTIIVEADPIWQQSAWKTSLYTFFLKLASYPSVKELQSPESSYMDKYSELDEDKFLSNIKKVNSDELPTNASDGTLHNNTGFYSILSGSHPNKNMKTLMEVS